ncbi:MAG: hypothetical protein QOC55_881 [Thermoleophilaceae bacterium]|nr:hypothetical protein [Thermoleophilaceae bacterium]
MKGRTLTLRAIALLAAGSAAIHQLRYMIGYGDAAPRALAAHPHGYLTDAVPAILTVLLIAIGGVLLRMARASAPTPRSRRTSFAALWLACVVALAAIYATQETLEGAGAIAGSGWIGLALAVPGGLVVALAMRGADAAEALRAPGALLRFAVLTASRLPLPRPVARATTAFVPLGARGPPLPFVV